LTTSSADTFTPFLSSPIFSFQCYSTLNDNCEIMQHCTHMNFFILVVFINHWDFYFFAILKKSVFPIKFCK
ncbi:unnamed protein product, partial [Staurois parvus]